MHRLLISLYCLGLNCYHFNSALDHPRSSHTIQHSYKYELITDLGSGMNYYKKGLTNLINQILNDEVKRLVITHKDRLLRFGAELIFSICESKEVEVVIINKGQEIASIDEELTQDVQEFITVLSSRLYGLNSKKNQKLIDNLSKAVNDNNSNLP